MRRPVILLAGCLLALGCGQAKMVRTSGRINAYMEQGNYAAALGALRQSKHEGFREQDRVVYWMNEGMLLHLLHNYRESTSVLEQAEKRSEELFTKSLRKQIKAAFVSPAATDYAGEDYERVLLNVVKALNYVDLGDAEGALVEARKINEKLQYYNTKYAQKNVYNQDAFAHWLMGLLFEMEHSYDDARIAYEKALEVYNGAFAGNYGLAAPAYVAEDLVRAALLGGDGDLAERYRKEYGASGETATALKDHGEIVLFHLNGQGPSKSDYFVTCWFRDAATWACDGEPGGEFIKRTRIDIPRDGTVVKVAFPELHLHAPANPVLTVSAGAATAQTQPAYPLNAIAAKSLRDKTGRIFRDAIIRVITKTLAQTAAGAAGKKAGGEGMGWLAKTVTSVATQATEEADKRAWTTLPARIDVARLMVKPGVYSVTLRLANGTQKVIPNVDVKAGQHVFLTYRSLP